jgi:hypothetical protein
MVDHRAISTWLWDDFIPVEKECLGFIRSGRRVATRNMAI